VTKITIVIPTWQPLKAVQVVNNIFSTIAPTKNSLELSLECVIVGSWPRDSVFQVPIGTSAFNVWPKITGPVLNMQRGCSTRFRTSDIIIFCHDDIEFHQEDNWGQLLVDAFNIAPKAGLIGLHGATGLGTEDIYRSKYRLPQLARINPISNMVEAEAHGTRVTATTRVATVDGFFMAFTAKAYEAMGQWQSCLDDGIIFHMYDSWAAMRLMELGYDTYMLPLYVHHRGGGTEVGMAQQYEDWCKSEGFKDGTDLHQQMHVRFYDRFRGKLPVRIS
jgi:hypothetical protein